MSLTEKFMCDPPAPRPPKNAAGTFSVRTHSAQHILGTQKGFVGCNVILINCFVVFFVFVCLKNTRRKEQSGQQGVGNELEGNKRKAIKNRYTVSKVGLFRANNPRLVNTLSPVVSNLFHRTAPTGEMILALHTGINRGGCSLQS